MWRIAAIALAAVWVASFVATSILRPIVHKRRERARGLGGTQDIALWGRLVGLVCMIGTGVCW